MNLDNNRTLFHSFSITEDKRGNHNKPSLHHSTISQPQLHGSMWPHDDDAIQGGKLFIRHPPHHFMQNVAFNFGLLQLWLWVCWPRFWILCAFYFMRRWLWMMRESVTSQLQRELRACMGCMRVQSCDYLAILLFRHRIYFERTEAG